MSEMKEHNKSETVTANILLAHGSKDPRWRTSFEILLEKIREHSPQKIYCLCYLELCNPSLSETVNNLIDNKGEINILFDELINETSLDEEIKNLIIYKKALFNSDFLSENDLLQMVNPIINSESIWKSHVLFLVAEYFYSKNQKKKADEYIQLLNNKKDK